ncbi:DNA-processing protein DprA [uncultured Schumannella sp.]|uniref:DNA-processing protein DprA n=1 Tax=uncultured Schumannella sp. TaxID=1195956 RepID=UPI0025FD0F20|nr:DNA-processing protein DprA [uncultured Schumannella sp.]
MATLAEQMQGERAARAALSMIAEPNDAATGRVLAHLGGIETLRLIESDDPAPGLARADALIWRERLAARITPDFPGRVAETQGGEFGTLIPADKEWPAGLDDLGDRAPYLLWTRGATSFLTTALSDRVTITGSRASTPYGDHVTGDLAMGMADEERIVVAGGAYGIEGAAHRAVLAAGGQTIAVLAGGLDRPYPAGHSDLLRQIGDIGLLVSELPPGTAPTRHRFIARNRLMAALSGATVIPEAGARSGSMTTVFTARELGRGVGAVPGPATSAASTGPNELIKQRFASLVTQPSDVIALLDTEGTSKRRAVRAELGQEFGRHRSEPGAPGRSI